MAGDILPRRTRQIRLVHSTTRIASLTPQPAPPRAYRPPAPQLPARPPQRTPRRQQHPAPRPASQHRTTQPPPTHLTRESDPAPPARSQKARPQYGGTRRARSNSSCSPARTVVRVRHQPPTPPTADGGYRSHARYSRRPLPRRKSARRAPRSSRWPVRT